MAVKTFYIFHGNDDLKMEEEVGKLRAKMLESANASMNIAEYDGTTTPVSEILGAAIAYPFLSDRRLIIVKDLLSWLTRKGAGEAGKKALEQLADQLAQLPEWTRLVFVERTRLPETHRILKLARSAENGFEQMCMAPDNSASWIIRRAGVYGAQIDARAAAALAAVTAGDLRSADNELFKLAVYVDGERPITEDDVALLTPYVAEASIFEMVDALAEGRAQQAALLARRLLDQDQDVFGLFGMIIRQFRLLIMVKEHLAAGGSRDRAAIARELGVHPYAAEKLSTQSRAFTLAQLEQIYRALHQYDLQVKTGRIQAELALDLLIASLSR